MPERVKPGVFRLAFGIDNISRDQCRPHVPAHDVGVIPQLAERITRYDRFGNVRMIQVCNYY